MTLEQHVAVLTFGPIVGQGYGQRIVQTVRSTPTSVRVAIFAFAFPWDLPQIPPTIAGAPVTPIELPSFSWRDAISWGPRLPSVLKRSGVTVDLSKFDLVILEGDQLLGLVPSRLQSRTIVVLHDDDALRYARAARAVWPSFRSLLHLAEAFHSWRWHRGVLRHSEARLWALGTPDAQRVSKRTRRAVTVVPFEADRRLLHVSADPQSERVVTFVGPANYEANVRAIFWFLTEVAPRCEQTFELHIVGRGWTDLKLPTAKYRIVRRGYQSELDNEYARCNVVIAPLLDGGGIKIKVVEGLTAARPVVATAIAAEGVPSSDGLIVRDEPSAFALALDLLLVDPRTAVACGRSARKSITGQTVLGMGTLIASELSGAP